MQTIPNPIPLAAPTARPSKSIDVRPAADPSNGRAFRAALNAARNRNDDAAADRSSGRSTGRPNGSARQDSSVRADGTARRQTTTRPDRSSRPDDASRTDDVESDADSSATDTGATPHELAALLAWLAPKTTTDAPATSLLALGGGNDQQVTATAGAPSSPTADALLATTVTTSQPGATDETTGAIPLSADLVADDGTGAIPLPTLAGTATPTATAASVAAAAAEQARLALQAANAALAAATGRSVDADPTTTLPTPPTGTAPETSTPAIQPSAPPPTAATTLASAATPTTWADLAASFGTQIVANTTPMASRTTPGQTGPAPTATGALTQPTSSTAQAAGATSAASLQLPGQAVAATGSTGSTGTATLAEVLQGRPAGETAPRPAQGATDPIQGFNAFLGMHGGAGLGQAQAATSVSGSAVTAPPLATQIADGAVAASRNLGQSVQMVLQPEGLGTVSLKVTLEHGNLGVHISVDNAQAREMLQASFSQLQQALDQRGLSVHSMQFDLSGGRGNGEAFQQFQQFNGQQFAGQQSQGQQSRGGGSRASVRERASALAIDESTRVQPGAANNGRVDYRI